MKREIDFLKILVKKANEISNKSFIVNKKDGEGDLITNLHK